MGAKGGRRASPVPLVTHICYEAVKGSKEKYSVNGRSSHPDVLYKKVLLKVSRFPQKNICVGVSFKQGYWSSVGNFIKKRLQHRR